MGGLFRRYRRLSRLIIDADKPWGAHGISNIKELAEAMAQGGILFRGASQIEKLAAGIPGQVLLTKGPNQNPVWGDVAGFAERLFYLTISGPPSISIATQAASVPGETATPGLTVPAPPSISKTVAATTVNAVGGAVSHNEDGDDTDETTAANNDTATDMTLQQADGALNDAYALGYASLFDGVVVNVGTVGAGITLAYEYSKGSGVWGTLTPILNQINDWETADKVWLTFERPADWATDTLAEITMYWIRMRTTAVGSFTQPKGNQAWVLVYA